MKRFVTLVTLLLVCTIAFSGCSKMSNSFCGSSLKEIESLKDSITTLEDQVRHLKAVSTGEANLPYFRAFCVTSEVSGIGDLGGGCQTYASDAGNVLFCFDHNVIAEGDGYLVHVNLVNASSIGIEPIKLILQWGEFKNGQTDGTNPGYCTFSQEFMVPQKLIRPGAGVKVSLHIKHIDRKDLASIWIWMPVAAFRWTQQ